MSTAVDVGTLLAIHLDGDEVAAELLADGRLLERLVRHHVTPVARRIADREKDRLVFAARPFERLLAPRIPVHGILCVLAEVRARFPGKAIHPAIICRASNAGIHSPWRHDPA